MNETANATLALGALPVMAHAGEEVEEMAGIASSLVLNIGTLSEHWVEAMLLAGGAATARGSPSSSTPLAWAQRVSNDDRAPDPRPRWRDGASWKRGRGGDARRREAEVRGVESIGTGMDPAELAREAARGSASSPR